MDDPFPLGMVDDIERFLETEHTRPPGCDLYPDVFATQLFFPLQRQRELSRMIRTARTVTPRVVMEIGADKGGGVYHWCKCLPSVERVIACEVRGTPYQHLFERAFPRLDFLWLPRSSYDPATVDEVRHWLAGDRIDVLFIDGDKSAFDRDFDLYFPFLSKRSVVFLHDVVEPPMSEVFATLRQQFPSEHIHDISDSLNAMRRQDQGIPVSCPHEGWLRHWRGRSCSVGVIYPGGRP